MVAKMINERKSVSRLKIFLETGPQVKRQLSDRVICTQRSHDSLGYLWRATSAISSDEQSSCVNPLTLE